MNKSSIHYNTLFGKKQKKREEIYPEFATSFVKKGANGGSFCFVFNGKQEITTDLKF